VSEKIWFNPPGVCDETQMTFERPDGEAIVWFVNGTHVPVDVYVNYHDEPEVTDLKPLEAGPDVTFGDDDRPYGTYTFEARQKGDPDGAVLAAGSLTVEDSQSYHACFHRVGADEFRFSTYQNDFSDTAETRLEVRHLAFPPTVEWRATPAPESDPDVRPDERSGTLERGEWQQARDLVENQYFFEVLVDGQRGAYQQTIEQETDKMLVVHVVGDLSPDFHEEEATRRVLVDELQVVTTDDDPRPVTTDPEPPLCDEDRNRRIEMDCPESVAYETNAAEAEATATDPDGIVTGMAIHSVYPASGNFEIPDGAFTFAENIGDTLTAVLRCSPDNLPGSYNVRLKANPESLGERATRDVLVDVREIDLARLRDLVDQYEASGDIRKKFADEMRKELDKTENALDAGNLEKTCKESEKFIKTASDNKDAGVSEPATVDIEVEGGRFHKNIGC
jgi:hypothetical protein